ncbi:hypothetical protein RND81_03G076900 [Saponaria officinalis]|uniref:Uncharacterized protein n=1 Tax=Saponaria officinalis TaxID=3572 RepID=A0AAW1M6K4_SAPOF
MINFVTDAKRLIGRRFRDNNLQNDTDVRPFKVINTIDPGKTDQPMISVNYLGKEKKFTPEEISAMTLAKMKAVAEAFTGSIVNHAVISVPAFFNDSQRRATKHAGFIAGFNVVHIINEPTATAMAYYDLEMKMNRINKNPKIVLVFDLGGGTFDVSLVVIEKARITVKAVSGDTHLGGADFDNRMVRGFVMEFEQKHKKDISKNAGALARLRVASEKAKRVLSLLPQADVQIDCLFEDIDFNSTITRASFEHLNMDLFEKCIDIVEQCLSYAGVNKLAVHDIVLVGGSSRIPKVQQMVQEFFNGKELCKHVHADEAVAFGAAMHAFSKSNGTITNKDIVLSDVTPLPLGVELIYGKMDFIIPMNEPIPIKFRHRSYPLAEDSYNGFKFGVYEGDQTNVKDNNYLGLCEFFCYHFPRGTTYIHVYFSVDEDGLLSVSAEVKEMGRLSQRIYMNHHGRLTQTEIVRMINEAEHYKAQIEKRRKLLQEKSDLENYVKNISDGLDDEGTIDINDLELERMKQAALDSALQLLERNSDLSEISVLAYKLEELKNIFGDFES